MTADFHQGSSGMPANRRSSGAPRRPDPHRTGNQRRSSRMVGLWRACALHLPLRTVVNIGSPPVKKGRHRRFEEARKLKQMGPDFLFSEPESPPVVQPEPPSEGDDEYAEIAA